MNKTGAIVQPSPITRPDRLHRAARPAPWTALSASVFVGLNMVLFSPALAWMAKQFTAGQHRFQLIALAAVLAVLVYRHGKPFGTAGYVRSWRMRFHVSAGPLLLYVLSATAFLLNERFLAVHVFSAAFSLSALFALWGMFCPRSTWRAGMLPVTLVMLLLPFGDYLDVYFGFPLRLFTADMAGNFLAAAGFQTVSADTLIVLENRFANVDVACSGIKGLWAGMVFFVLLTWVENKTINRGWCWRLGVFVGVLLVTNAARVAAVVALGLGFDAMPLADTLHQGLGVLGFAFACLLGWLLLLTATTTTPPSHGTTTDAGGVFAPQGQRTQLYAGVLLAILTALFCASYTPLPKPDDIANNIPLALPVSWQGRVVALSPQEAEFFPRNAALARKYRFDAGSPWRGSVIFVQSAYWKAHHDPRNCLAAQGYSITGDQTVSIGGRRTVRRLTIKRHKKTATAVYWFQSADRVTGDFSTRLFADLFSRGQWVMVSAVVESPALTPDAVYRFAGPLMHAVKNQMNKVNP